MNYDLYIISHIVKIIRKYVNRYIILINYHYIDKIVLIYKLLGTYKRTYYKTNNHKMLYKFIV